MKSPLLFLCLIILASNSFAQSDTLTYSKRVVMIQMRDGVKLNTVVYTPQKSQTPLPIMFMRTPYGIDDIPSPNKMEYISDMAREGYIFAFQDIRGRYK